MNSLKLGLVFGIAASVATMGCGGSDFMHEAPAPHTALPPAGSANVVFVRPSVFAGAIKTTILDEHGGFLGESLASSQFSVTVPAGKHLFIAWAENTAVLQADLAAGKTYYVEVSPKMGALSARMHLLAITPRSESWPKLAEWLHDARPYDPDQAAGQAYLAGRRDDVKERLRRATEALQKYDRDELAQRTLNPDDGR